MPGLRSASVVFEEEFLSIRAKLLEVAASLDRIYRTENGLDATDPRVGQLRAAVETLLRREGDRAERIQLIFSRPYEDDWQAKFRMTNDE